MVKCQKKIILNISKNKFCNNEILCKSTAKAELQACRVDAASLFKQSQSTWMNLFLF